MNTMDCIHQIKFLGDLLLFQEGVAGKKEAVVCGKERLTYGQLAARARVVALRLQKLGVQAGDRVGMVIPTGIDCIVAFCGTLLAGATVAPLDPHSTAYELKQVLVNLRPKILIAHSDKLLIAFNAGEETEFLKGILFIKNELALQSVTHAVKVDVIDSWHTDDMQPAQLLPESDLMPAVIFYTSGTTGKSKGVIHTHKGFLASIEARFKSWRPNAADRILCLITMNSALEWSAIVMTSIRYGATLIVATRNDSDYPVSKIREQLKLITSEKITVLPGVPAMFQLILREHEHLHTFPQSTLRVCWCASGHVSLQLAQATEKFFGVPLLVFFGMTEMCGPFLLNRLDMQRKIGSVGMPAPGFCIEIRDDAGKVLSPGAENVGMMFVSGSSVMLGYLNQSKLTDKILKDKWIATGDLAYKDNDGYIFVLGRRDDRINCAGTKIYPEEVESVIGQCPGVKEVAAVGMPSILTGECVKAVIVLADGAVTENMLRKYCEKHMAAYKIPQRFEFIDKLPRTARGKIKRKLLKNTEH